ncbi:DEAD/DEAH box helicase [Candidatus Saccharibacteria bacterium]|nr:DEAD/DEAH box helicase [Candidatus Saccharibacteria bacterium]
MSYSYTSRSSHYNKPRPSNGRGRRNQPNKQTIHASKFVQAAKPVQIDAYTPTHQFADFTIHSLLKQNIIAKGYKTPSPIQDQAIPHGLNGQDIIGIANTGTGKTAAFAIPILNKLFDDKKSRALIIAPTRELAQQIEEEFRSFAKGSGLFGALLIGGSSMGLQLRDLRSNPNIVIGTPGRIKDHLERRTLNLSLFNIIVLDEVDRMVDMGFINDIRYLLGALAPVRQSLFFSATIDPKIEGLIQSFLTNPVTISVKTGQTGENIEQNVIRYNHSSEKIDKLHDLLTREDVAKTLIFDETHRNVDRLTKELEVRGFNVDAIHGGKSQGHRQQALRRFRNNDIKVLVATDVAARGIDISDITHVINYSVPNTYDDYIHRIGRAGRAGRIGHALTFVNP